MWLTIISKHSWDRFIKLILLWLLIPVASFGQEYGLEFAGKPVSKDLRTKLNLNPDGYYSFHGDFELSFSIRIRDIQPATFGYILRIVDNEDRHIDVIFGPAPHTLHVVTGQSLTSLKMPENDRDIYNTWNDIRLKYDIRNRILNFQTPDTLILQHEVDFSGRIKLFFGKNDFNPIETTDVPRMNVRDIRLYQKGKCVHYFPLNELTGNFAQDVITNGKAAVQNPGWIKPGYHDWEESFDITLSGLAATCYDPVAEKVYMVGDTLMRIFWVMKDSTEEIEYSNRFSDLLPGSQVFFDTIAKKLFCYNLQIKTIHYFDPSIPGWTEISNGPDIVERYWFHNKYYSAPDTVLYIIGGYSQHKYFNLVQRYDFKTGSWDTLKYSGENFHPRMHAAIGSYADTLFILGGFGSKAGDQILKPEHYTDLMAFSLKEREFIKKFEFQAPMEDLDFAHSMVIDAEDQSYYTLATTIFEYDTYLQLLRGNLGDPILVKLGSKIPYKFHNEYSYCDLFYSKSSRRLIAMTLLADWDRNETHIAVYTISFPPFITVTESDADGKVVERTVIGVMLFLVVIVAAVVLRGYMKRKGRPSGIRKEGKELRKATYADVPAQSSIISEKQKKTVNSILFFGGFQVFNREGSDITKKFTPLLKELFLLIFLHSIKDKGISVPRLTELLWFSMDAKTAKNNRAVNIAKLKNLLNDIESCALSHKTSYWQMEFDDSVVYNDYWSCIKSIHRKEALPREDLLHFLSIIKKGPLLGNASYEWLDEFKLECSNLIIDSLTRYVDQDNLGPDHELMIQVADAILIFDMMHEEAISIKCKALTALGKHSLAKEIFNKFSKDYFTLYDEPFNRSFTDIIKK